MLSYMQNWMDGWMDGWREGGREGGTDGWMGMDGWTLPLYEEAACKHKNVSL
jgi:hypothetical protein